MSFCICLSNFVVIRRLSAELWRYIYFSRWPPAAILDLIWLMLDHPRSAIAGLSLILKFGFDPIYSYRDNAIFKFCCFGWKLPIHAHFLGSFEGIFPQIWSPIVLTPWTVEKVTCFRLFGEKPPLYRLKPKFAWRVNSPTQSRVQSFKMKFLGVTILQGRGSNFPFSYWFLHGPYNSAARLHFLRQVLDWSG